MGIFGLFNRRKTRQPDRVTFTEDGVSRVRPDGAEERIRWDELHEVGILTTDEGPIQEDVFFLLIASDGKSGCVVPQGADGCAHLLKRLQKLPGFDNEAVIKAMGSSSNAKFVCWKKQVAHAANWHQPPVSPCIGFKFLPLSSFVRRVSGASPRCRSLDVDYVAMLFFKRIADLVWFRFKKQVALEEIELPFGVRISVSFLHFLRRSTAKAHKESQGTEPRLCAEERVDYRRSSPGGPRVDFSKDAEVLPTNRLAQPSAPSLPVTLSKERSWVLRFEKTGDEPESTFEVCGVRLHISKKAQVELKGGTLYSALDKIYVKYER